MNSQAATPTRATLRERIALVDTSLVPPKAIRQAEAEGARHLADSRDSLLPAALALARRNPVCGAAFGLGALEGAGLQADPGAQAEVRAALGIALVWWGYYYEARPLLDQAVAHLQAREVGRAHLYAGWHLILCERRFRVLPDAVDTLLQMADDLEAMGDTAGAMGCRQDAALQISLSEQPDEADSILETAGQYFADQGLIGDQGISLLRQAYIRLNRGELEAGRARLDRAEACFVQADMPALLGAVWMYRGLYFYHRREAVQAAYWLEEAGNRAAALQHRYYLALSLIDMATLQYHQGDTGGSLETHDAIGDLAAELRLPYLTASSEMAAANLRFRQGDLGAAVEGYAQAGRLFEETGYVVSSAVCTMNLGVAARRQGRFAESLRLLNQALEIFTAHDAYEHRANARHNLGKTYAAFGYFEPASEHFRAGIEILEDAGAPAQAVRPAIYLADLLAGRDETAQAMQLLGRAGEQADAAGLEMDAAVCERVRAGVLLRRGEIVDALDAYRDSFERLTALGQEEAAWEARLGIAECHVRLGKSDAAARELEAMAGETLPVIARWRYHTLVAQMADLRGQDDQAMAAYLDALSQIRAARRSLSREDEAAHFVIMLQAVYDEAFDVALRSDDPGLGLAVVELYGGQLLSVRLGREAAAQDEPHALPARVTSLLGERLGDAWTVLRYAWHRDDLWLFALTPTGLERHAVRLDAEARLALRLCASPDDSFRTFIYRGESRFQGDTTAIGRDRRRYLLRALLPGSIRARLEPGHTLIVVPSHQLYGLAFHALLDGDEPLIERACVVYAHSLDLLRTSLERAGSDGGLGGRGLIVAQSRFDRQGYDPLPHVEREVEVIAGAVGERAQRVPAAGLDRHALVRDGESGTFAAYDWLHIATHTYAEPVTGFFTGLLFGSEILDLEDIYRWRLAARLVTLSACQTGMGRWYYGDEIAGLTQAFMGAGAETVVASLWRVADERVSRLMADFYRRLGEGMRPAAALAQTQRRAHRSGVEAYYWAPFCVFGRP